MMANAKVGITFEIEPVVKLYCTNAKCRFNMLNLESDAHSYACCLLKIIVIDDGGKCAAFEPNEEKGNAAK